VPKDEQSEVKDQFNTFLGHWYDMVNEPNKEALDDL
jgi:hypothetical protein